MSTAAIFKLPAELVHESLLYVPILDVYQFARTCRQAWSVVHDAEPTTVEEDDQEGYLWKALFKRDFDVPTLLHFNSPSSNPNVESVAEEHHKWDVKQHHPIQSAAADKRWRTKQDTAAAEPAEHQKWKWKQEAIKRDAILGVLASRANAVEPVQMEKNGYTEGLESEAESPSRRTNRRKAKGSRVSGIREVEMENRGKSKGTQAEPVNALERQLGNSNRSLTMSEVSCVGLSPLMMADHLLVAMMETATELASRARKSAAVATGATYHSWNRDGIAGFTRRFKDGIRSDPEWIFFGC